MKRFSINGQLTISNWQLAKSKNHFVSRKIFILPVVFCLLLIVLISCNNKKEGDHSQHQQSATGKQLYTCPMPEDSVFSNKPGKCPKCGMGLVKIEEHDHSTHQQSATSNEEGKTSNEKKDISLETLLKPTNQYVITSLPLISAKQSEEPVEIDVLGHTAYNTSSVGMISARIGGRIEKLYVKYRYQKISKGQRIMDIYSPELMTAQQNLLLLLKNDKENTTMIEAAKQRLLLLGFSQQQMQQVIQSGNSSMTIAVYSSYSGHIHEASSIGNMAQSQAGQENMNTALQTTQGLNLKEGMYVQKGQPVFSVYDPSRLWVLLNIYPQDQFFVKAGDKVRIIPETKPGSHFRATISYIEPFFRKESKTIAARVNYDNSELKLPVGTQVKATIFSGSHSGYWLPKEAVLSLGLDKIVFLKTSEGFKVHKVETGHAHNNLLQIITGLTEKDSVAVNAQYLIDSESFVKINGEP